MPNYRRADAEGGCYFFTVNTLHRQPFLIEASVRGALREAIDMVRKTLPFAVDAWVLLPDHLHCLWTLPPGDADFATRWKLIKTKVTQQCGDRQRTKTLGTCWAGFGKIQYLRKFGPGFKHAGIGRGGTV